MQEDTEEAKQKKEQMEAVAIEAIKGIDFDLLQQMPFHRLSTLLSAVWDALPADVQERTEEAQKRIQGIK